VRWGGNIDQLKSFLSNDLPVMVETWQIHEGDGLGHYRLITGYDDASGQFNTFDSLNGPDYKVSYEQFDAYWRVFNRPYLVIYTPEQTQTVLAIIGDNIDKTIMYERALAQAQAEAEANPNDTIAYFNQGEILTRLGRHQEAVVAFDRARQLGLHWRRLWYQFTPYEAYYVVGRYQDVLDLTEATLEGTGGLEEAYYYHGLALHATSQPGAVEDFQAALEYNPLFNPAAEALSLLLADR
jgi:tetratricopeptide (TPR) repeat protein